MVEIRFPEIDLKNVKGVLIDLDDTIYSYQEAHLLALEKSFKFYNSEINNKDTFFEYSRKYRQFRDIVTQDLSPQAACRSRILAFQKWFEIEKIKLPYTKALKMDHCYWNNLIESMSLSKNAYSFLSLCKSKEIPICIVTDMTVEQQIKKIDKLGIENLIDALVSSEEAGAEKPSPKIFSLALAKLRLSSSEVIMIGDSEKKDILGASQLGIKSYKVTHEE